MKIIQYLSVCFIFFLVGCDNTDHEPVEIPVKEGHIMSGHLKALEKAKEVQEKTDEAVKKQQQAIDEVMGNK